MTSEQCDVLVAVNAQPGRRMLLAEMTPRNRKLAMRFVRGGDLPEYLIHFEGDWVALTDRGYDAMIEHCAKNF